MKKSVPKAIFMCCTIRAAGQASHAKNVRYTSHLSRLFPLDVLLTLFLFIQLILILFKVKRRKWSEKTVF